MSGFDTGFDLDREYGLFLALLAAIGLAAGGFLKSQGARDRHAPAAGPPPRSDPTRSLSDPVPRRHGGAPSRPAEPERSAQTASMRGGATATG